jgi:hypothetical protein
VRINCSDALIERGSVMLAATVERFQMPPDLMGIVHDKSTWARRGLVVQPARSARRPSRCRPFRAALARANNDTTAEWSRMRDQSLGEQRASFFARVAADVLTSRRYVERMIRRATKFEPRIRSRIPHNADDIRQYQRIGCSRHLDQSRSRRAVIALGHSDAQIVFRVSPPRTAEPGCKASADGLARYDFLDLQ